MAFGNGPRLVTTGLDLLVDAADRQSYPGSGTVWTDLRSGTTGSLTGSVAYTSEFYGGLTFSNSSSAVIFPSTTANYGTGSFTVEMAFKPTFINGRHYLMSKNSGSFPNWAIYLSGSNGSGKLWSEFRPTAAISCSVSSSTTFVTGSVYQVDVTLAPGQSGSGFSINGIFEGGAAGNGGGSLTNTSSLFIGNFSQNNTQNFSGSIFTAKIYSVANFILPTVNYNATSTRFSRPPIPETSKRVFELLVVAGGGGAGDYGGGGGAGGLQYFPNFLPEPGVTRVVVGAGGNGAIGGNIGFNGQNSSYGNITSIGGGRGGRGGGTGINSASFGGSGGGSNIATITSGTLGQGNNGGTALNGGGGGGAGTAGSSSFGGSGSFLPSFAAIGGSPAGWFAGGGSGGGGGTFPGGIGGGGSSPSNDGVANTGGGGSSGGFAVDGRPGGSGIVAIRYNGVPIALGGEITQSAGFTYHVFRTTGSSTFTIF
jgi:hypothetical protein